MFEETVLLVPEEIKPINLELTKGGTANFSINWTDHQESDLEEWSDGEFLNTSTDSSSPFYKTSAFKFESSGNVSRMDSKNALISTSSTSILNIKSPDKGQSNIKLEISVQSDEGLNILKSTETVESP
eukprot:Awhi_evm1s3075